MNFKTGQKVICIDNSNSYDGTGKKCPIPKNAILIIESICSCCGGLSFNDYPDIYSASRFRPLTESQQEIEYRIEGKKLIETPTEKEMRRATYEIFDFHGIDASYIPEINTGIIKFLGTISKIYSN